MSTADKVRKAPTPQVALVAIAEAIDELRHDIAAERREKASDGWDWPAAGPAFEVSGDEEDTLIQIKPVSKDKQVRRLKFAVHSLKLDEALPGVEAVDAFVRGGPLWLWMSQRELVLQYPMEMRRQMVADVMEDDPEAAKDMGADILKLPTSAQNPGLPLAEGVGSE